MKKICKILLISPSLILAYMGVFGMQISSTQVVSAMALLAIWFLYITNPITNPLE